MPKCPLYQSQATDDDALDTGGELSVSVSIDTAPSCQHRCLSGSTLSAPDCNGDFTRCAVQLDDQQLSDFIKNESRSRRVAFIFNPGDDQGALKVDSDSWLALELIRRFGKRQTRGVETALTIKNNRFQFSVDNKPLSFGDSMVFPLDLVWPDS